MAETNTVPAVDSEKYNIPKPKSGPATDWPGVGKFDPSGIVKQLIEGSRGIGTEERVSELLQRAYTPSQLTAINDAYVKVTGKDLKSLINEEFSSSFFLGRLNDPTRAERSDRDDYKLTGHERATDHFVYGISKEMLHLSLKSSLNAPDFIPATKCSSSKYQDVVNVLVSAHNISLELVNSQMSLGNPSPELVHKLGGLTVRTRSDNSLEAADRVLRDLIADESQSSAIRDAASNIVNSGYKYLSRWDAGRVEVRTHKPKFFSTETVNEFSNTQPTVIWERSQKLMRFVIDSLAKQ
jgi:hypothetical protein